MKRIVIAVALFLCLVLPQLARAQDTGIYTRNNCVSGPDMVKHPVNDQTWCLDGTTASLLFYSGNTWTAIAGAGSSPALAGDTTGPANANVTRQLHRNTKLVTTGMSPYTQLSTDSYIDCNASAGPVTINLLATNDPTNPNGNVLTFKKMDSSGNACVIVPNAGHSDTIDGASSVSITTQYAPLNIQNDITNAGSWAIWTGSGGISAGVTSVATGTGLQGGTITSTGTLSLVVPVTEPLGGTGSVVGPTRIVIAVTNDTTTGTINNQLAKYTTGGTLGNISSRAILTSHTDLTGARGVVVTDGGITGSAKIQTDGRISCQFDGSTTANDYVVQSPTQDGQCHDAGATWPTDGHQVIGTASQTKTGAGVWGLDLFGLTSQPGLVASVTLNPPLVVGGTPTNPTFSLGIVPENLGGTNDNYGPAAVKNSVQNDSTTGTTVNLLAKYTTGGTLGNIGARAIITASTDTAGARGIVVAGAGTTGSAILQVAGIANCLFDGATTTNDYVVQSPTVAGQCHDAGSSLPSQQIIGYVNVTRASGGAYPVTILGLGAVSASSGSTTGTQIIPNDTGTGTGTNLLVKLNAGSAIKTATGDTGTIIGICVAGCGTSGNATVQQLGQASCVFSNTAVAGDYVLNSPATAGDCLDAGITLPAAGGNQLIGRALTSGSGTQTISLLPPENYGPGNVVALGNYLPGGGTTLNKLVKFSSASTGIITTAAGDTNGIVGVCAANCGTTGFANIQFAGVGNCIFDGPTVASDYVINSPSVAGDCSDAGAGTPSTGAQVIGRAGSTLGGAGLGQILLFPPESLGMTYPVPEAAGGTFSTIGPQDLKFPFANDTTTGTTVNHLAKVNSSAKAILTATTDKRGAVGIVTSGAGTSGNAVIQVGGAALCQMDGAGLVGDYVVNSFNTAGDCHSQSSPPTDGLTQIVGIRLSSGTGVRSVLLFPTPVVGVYVPTGTPSIASSPADCATGAAIDTFAKDTIGSVVAGTDSPTQTCKITFSGSYLNAPTCTVSDAGPTVQPLNFDVTPTSITIKALTDLHNNTLNWRCDFHG